MHLYNLTLQQASAIQKAIYGNFSSSKAQQIAVCRGKTLELFRIDQSGKLILTLTEQLFCVTRAFASLRFQGMDHDLLVVGSDSGRVVILEYNVDTRHFGKIHEETFGKTGCRRITPGQYLAVDPKGRAFMIAAIEKQKFVYTLNRQSNRLIISSPRQAHKSHTLCLDIVGLDVGQENAQFASLQIDYGDTDDKNSLVVTGGIKKSLVFYEMDFGMNYVIRKKEVEVPESAHLLMAVPNMPDGPGGLLIACENYLLYRNDKTQKGIAIPRRKGRPTDRQSMIITYTLYKQKDCFFFLIQNELGDVFKITFTLSETNRSELLNIELEYFDSLPPCVSICVSKKGFVFCAAEKGPHIVYDFLKQESKHTVVTNLSIKPDEVVEFKVKPLENLKQVSQLDNISCPTALLVDDLREQGMSQIYLLCGAGSRSCLKVIKQGLQVRQLANRKIPKPQFIWSLKSKHDDKFDRYMILSFIAHTTVLLIDEKGSISQNKSTGIDNTVPTIHIGMFQNNSILQVVANGFWHIKDTKIAKTSFQGKIMKAASNLRQLVLALAGGDLVYYQLDSAGSLTEVMTTTLECEVSSLDIGPIPHNHQRSNFLAVGLSDHTTRIFDLTPDSCLKKLSVQTFPCSVESVCILEMQNDENQEEGPTQQLFLYVGLSSGILMRTSIDNISGKLTDSRSRFLGLKPVKCIRTTVHGKPGLLALSSRPWLIYNYMDHYMTSLLSCPSLQHATQLCISSCEHGLVGLGQNYMKILNIETFGDLFHSESIPLDYTPRKMVVSGNKLVILEYDQRTMRKEEEEKMWVGVEKGVEKAMVGQFYGTEEQYYGHIRVYTPKTKTTNQLVLLEENQVCVSVTNLKVLSKGKDYVCVGCVKGLKNKPKKSFIEASIHTYIWQDNKLTLLHKTPVTDIPYALHGWSDNLVAGVGDTLRAYQVGTSKLLLKAQLKRLNSPVNSISSMGQRIFATQIADSFHIYKYKAKQRTFYDIADDILPRYVTCANLLDYHTMIGADKFENIFVSRAPSNAEEDYENNPNSYKFRWENGYLNGAPFKMEQICSFFVGEVVTCMQKTSLVSTGSEVVIYCTTNGSICALYPFENREDIDFFTHLELFMKSEIKPLGGRDHSGFRSFYSPCKGIMDGDLCELFERLPYDTQAKLAGQLQRNPQQVHKKLEQIRNKIL